MTIHDIEKMSVDDAVEKIRNILRNYSPRTVFVKEQHKPGNKKQPYGIACIWDRLIQQCMLQVLEPICEAKFSESSYGFRPDRTCKNAIGHVYRLMQLSHLHYAVEIDIRDLYRSANQTKLIRQIWALGIRDKKLIYIIRRVLEAPL